MTFPSHFGFSVAGGARYAVIFLVCFLWQNDLEAQIPVGNLKFTPITPCRVADTRNGYGGAIATGTSRTIAMHGVCNLPSTAQAYALNLTLVPVAGSNGVQSVTLAPTSFSGGATVTISNPNSRIRANNAILGAGSQGSIDIKIAAQNPAGSTHAIVDVNGYFSDSSLYVYYPLPPCRIADTRLGYGGILQGTVTRDFLVSGLCGVPLSAKAFSLNFTMVPPGPVGWLTVFPTGSTQPTVSTMNNLDGFILANGAIQPAGSGGRINLYSSDSTHMIIDVSGYFDFPGGPSSASTLTVINPCRGASGPVNNGSFSLTSCASANSSGYAMNATLQPSIAVGFLTVWPTGQMMPTVSLLNALQNEVVSNGMIGTAGTGGAVSGYINGGAATLSLDVTGYFTPVSGGGGGGTAPSYQGSVTSAGCTSVNGWVMNANNPSMSMGCSLAQRWRISTIPATPPMASHSTET
jgi:hypothetical protein